MSCVLYFIQDRFFFIIKYVNLECSIFMAFKKNSNFKDFSVLCDLIDAKIWILKELPLSSPPPHLIISLMLLINQVAK